jgi:hypothetical protein
MIKNSFKLIDLLVDSFNQLNPLATDFAVRMIGNAYATEPLPTDEHLPNGASRVVSAHPLERRNIDTTAAVSAAVEVYIFRNYRARLDLPILRRSVFLPESLESDIAFLSTLEMCFEKIDCR